LGIHFVISRSWSGWRFRDDGIDPSSDPSEAKTKEFSPIRSGRRAFSEHVDLTAA
jgi:hypothetical protein